MSCYCIEKLQIFKLMKYYKKVYPKVCSFPVLLLFLVVHIFSALECRNVYDF